VQGLGICAPPRDAGEAGCEEAAKGAGERGAGDENADAEEELVAAVEAGKVVCDARRVRGEEL
jgi:hypothetical protein